jgi:hypothetical protein
MTALSLFDAINSFETGLFRLPGKVTGKRTQNPYLLTLKQVRVALEELEESKRMCFEVLDLSYNFMGEEDLVDVVDMLHLLPNVCEIDLSAWFLYTTSVEDVRKIFAAAPKLTRLFVLNSDLCSFAGKPFFAQLNENEIGKIIFMGEPCELESRLWTDMIEPEHQLTVARAHVAFFKDNFGDMYNTPTDEETVGFCAPASPVPWD